MLFPHWPAAIRGWADDFGLEVEQDGALRQLRIVAGGVQTAPDGELGLVMRSRDTSTYAPVASSERNR